MFETAEGGVVWKTKGNPRREVEKKKGTVEIREGNLERKDRRYVRNQAKGLEGGRNPSRR